MFNIGDVIIYSVHGLSKIDDICEKTVANVTKMYYVLHPLEQSNLIISTPVDNDKVVMLKMMEREEAEEVLNSFRFSGIKWIDDSRQRNMNYQEMVKEGNRREIAKVANTLMRKEVELKQLNKKLYDQDHKILDTIQNILFKELAASLNTTTEKVSEQAYCLIKKS